MKYTKSYDMNLPDMEDQFDIDHWNENTEKTDSALHGLQVQSDSTDATVEANRKDAQNKIDAINAKISPQASAQNQLADKKYVTDRVAEVVANAPDDFDTLKEMSDWISKHEDSAAAMNSAISANESALAAHKDDKSAHGATTAATANRIALRDGSGRLKAASPSANDDVATKSYVDSQSAVITQSLTVFAKCATAANNAEKGVSIPSVNVGEGTVVMILFTNGHTLHPTGEWGGSPYYWRPRTPNISLKVTAKNGTFSSYFYDGDIVCNGSAMYHAGDMLTVVWYNNRWQVSSGLRFSREFPDAFAYSGTAQYFQELDLTDIPGGRHSHNYTSYNNDGNRITFSGGSQTSYTCSLADEGNALLASFNEARQKDPLFNDHNSSFVGKSGRDLANAIFPRGTGQLQSRGTMGDYSSFRRFWLPGTDETGKGGAVMVKYATRTPQREHNWTYYVKSSALYYPTVQFGHFHDRNDDINFDMWEATYYNVGVSCWDGAGSILA